MENIILQILKSDGLNLIQIIALLIILLFFLVKQRKTNEKIDIISENHLHTIQEGLNSVKESLERIERKLDDGFKDVSEKITIIKTIQEQKKK